MNRQIITPLLAAAAAVAVAAIPALAQEAAAPAAPPAAPAADAAPAPAVPAGPPVSDDEVKAVAMMVAAYPKITDAPDGGPNKVERVYAMLKAFNLSYERYNAIATQARGEPELGVRIAAAEPDEASVTAAVEATIEEAKADKVAAEAAAKAAAEEAARAQAAAEAAAGPPPALPTSGDGAVITSLLNNVCVPMVKGGDITKLAKAAGGKKDSKTQQWVIPMGEKPYQVSIEPPGANRTVCTMHVRYRTGTDKTIMDSLNVWRFLNSPRLHAELADIRINAKDQRTTTTWDNYDTQMKDGSMVGLILVQIDKKEAAGTALNPAYDEADVQFQIRRAQPVPPATAASAAPTPAG